MTKKITVHLAAFFAAIAVMWGLLVLTSLIPNEKIYEGLMESADYYGNTEAFSFENSGKLCDVADNYADAILLNILWNIDSSHPVYSSLDTKYYSGAGRELRAVCCTERRCSRYGLFPLLARLGNIYPSADGFYERSWGESRGSGGCDNSCGGVLRYSCEKAAVFCGGGSGGVAVLRPCVECGAVAGVYPYVHRNHGDVHFVCAA